MGGLSRPTKGGVKILFERRRAQAYLEGMGAEGPSAYLVGEDLHQNLMFPQLVPHEKLVLCTYGHILADSYHSVILENCCYFPTEEPDEA